MADEFDIIDFVYNAVEASKPGLVICKDKSHIGIECDHIVINHLDLQEFDFYNILPVNVNIFIKLKAKGVIDRERMKDVKRKVRQSLDSIKPVNGEFRGVNSITSGRIEGKEGFDSFCIRLEIETDN